MRGRNKSGARARVKEEKEKRARGKIAEPVRTRPLMHRLRGYLRMPRQIIKTSAGAMQKSFALGVKTKLGWKWERPHATLWGVDYFFTFVRRDRCAALTFRKSKRMAVCTYTRGVCCCFLFLADDACFFLREINRIKRVIETN